MNNTERKAAVRAARQKVRIAKDQEQEALKVAFPVGLDVRVKTGGKTSNVIVSGVLPDGRLEVKAKGSKAAKGRAVEIDALEGFEDLNNAPAQEEPAAETEE